MIGLEPIAPDHTIEHMALFVDRDAMGDEFAIARSSLADVIFGVNEQDVPSSPVFKRPTITGLWTRQPRCPLGPDRSKVPVVGARSRCRGSEPTTARSTTQRGAYGGVDIIDVKSTTQQAADRVATVFGPVLAVAVAWATSSVRSDMSIANAACWPSPSCASLRRS